VLISPSSLFGDGAYHFLFLSDDDDAEGHFASFRATASRFFPFSHLFFWARRFLPGFSAAHGGFFLGLRRTLSSDIRFLFPLLTFGRVPNPPFPFSFLISASFPIFVELASHAGGGFGSGDFPLF